MQCSFTWDFEKQHRFSPVKKCCRQADKSTFFLKKKRINKRKKMSFGLINEIFSFKGVPLTTTAKTHNRKFYVKVGRSVWCKQGTSTALHCDLKFNHTSISSGIQILTRYLSVFLKTSMKPQRFGCLLLIRYLFKFNFSKLAQLTILQAGFEKNSILYINPDFWVPLRNFFLNLGALSIKHARGFKVSTLIFLKILPLWCKPQLFGCLLLIRYLFKFNFSKLQ